MGLLSKTRMKPGPKPGTLRSPKSTRPAKGGKPANLLASAMVPARPHAVATQIKPSIPKTSAKASVVRPNQIKKKTGLPAPASKGGNHAMATGISRANKLL